MRNAYLSTLYSLAEENPDVIAMVADNGTIVYDRFRERFPDQFINCGIAEANMVAVAAGLASCGKIPFAYTISGFITMRAFEMVRNDICLQRQNVKLVGIGAGFVYSTLGPTHHATEDITVMRVLPGLTILSPASPIEAQKATVAAYNIDGPVYLRLGTANEPEIYGGEYQFKVGKGVVVTEGTDVTVIATGSIVYDALLASKELREEGISVKLVNMHTIKPLDDEIITESAKQTGAILTLEEHSIIGGLGSAVAESLLENGNNPVVFERMGLNDCFPKGYGNHQSLKIKNGLSKDDIKQKVVALYYKKMNQ